LKLHLHYYLKKPDVRNEIAGKMEGSTGRQRVPKNVLFDAKIPLPSYEEQIEISDIFISLDEKIDATESKKKSLHDLFKSMLQLLMTGQVRVKDVDFGKACE
jgi:type I restriction enzyme S subunit